MNLSEEKQARRKASQLLKSQYGLCHHGTVILVVIFHRGALNGLGARFSHAHLR